MKTFKSKLFRFPASLALACLLFNFAGVASVQAQSINSGAGAYMFPHNATYPHGFMATGLPSTAASNGVSATYLNWYSHAVINTGVTRSGFPTCTGCARVYRNTNGNDTVSEGIGYGMLIAVMMDDKTLFDSLYKYAYQWMPDSSNNMVMDWQLTSGGGIMGANGATDADEDMAMAFLIASKIWPSAAAVALTNSQQTAVSKTYQQTYEDMVTAIWTQETKGGAGVYSGDAFQYPFYSSYMTPAWYNCWNSSDTFGRNWSSVSTWVYNTYFKTLFTTDNKGFMPDTATGPGIGNNVSTMSFDASRYPLRIGIDYLWNGSAGAVSYAGAFATNVMTAVNSSGFATQVGDNWSVPGGTPGGSFCDSLQIGPLAVAAMMTNAANATSAYNELIARYGSPGCNGGAENFQYFQDTLCMLSELVCTGNFPNIVCGTPPCGSQTCTPTPSPTPLACYMVSDDVDGTEENHTNGFWFSYSYASVLNTPVKTPVLVGVSNTNYILQANGPTGKPYADSVTGYCAINGGVTIASYGSVTNAPSTVYAGYALGTELLAGYQNLNSMSNISFWVEATKAPVTLQIAFYNANIDVPAGGNANQYKNTAPIIVSTANTWQFVSIASGIANIAPSSYAPALGSGPTTYTYSMAMSNVTSLQWQEIAPSTGVTYGFSVGQVCIAGTSWVTPTPLATATPVVTILPTNTRTLTPTVTLTATKTITPTVTVTQTTTATTTRTQTTTMTQTPTTTTTRTQTLTPTQTSASSPTFTATPTVTRTATTTATQTVAFSPTFTGTPTATRTLTVTATVTSTNTVTFTPSVTLTRTVSSTPTQTSSPTITITPPATATPTLTGTMTLTPTVTLTRTVSATPTVTASPTITSTPLPTSTATQTPTITATPLFSNTPTFTFTQTQTTTPTATLTTTWTATRTWTPLFTSTITPTSTNTLAFTSTTTSTPTFTLTPTFTSTLVPTDTFTPSLTPTPVPGVSFGAPIFTGTSQAGDPFVYTIPFTISNSTATNITFSDVLPSGLNFSGFGTIPAGGTPSGSTITWPSLPAGTYNIVVNGTINNTATGTLTNSATLSFDGGGPLTSSPASVVVVVLTATPTVTQSPTATAIISVPVTEPIPYPNPSTTTAPISVSVSFGQPTGPVHLEIFTTAFRKIRDINEGPVPVGTQNWTLYLADDNGIDLANGLYYLVISTPNGRSIGKILVLR